MTQRRPIVREVYSPAFVPQVIATACLAGAIHLTLPTMQWGLVLFIAATVYLAFCRTLRVIFLRDHTFGMRAYHAGEFETAITHYQACRDYFTSHRRLDACRSLMFGVSNRNPFAVVSLGNMAYCHAQLGHREKAIELYQHVLAEAPGHAMAVSMLNLLEQPGSAPPSELHVPSP